MAFLLKKIGRAGSREAREISEGLERDLQALAVQRLERMAHILTALERGWKAELEEDLKFVVETTRARMALRTTRKKNWDGYREALDVEPEHKEPLRLTKVGDRLRFQVSVRFLRECAEYLTTDPQGRERLVLVTGTVTPDGLRILGQMVKVSFDEQNAAYVSASAAETHRRLIELERDGHQLLAMFHSHIMHGAESTRPSQVDIDTQNRFLAFGWDAIGGIFSLDHHVRFFGTGKPLDVGIYGTGAKVLDRADRNIVVKLET